MNKKDNVKDILDAVKVILNQDKNEEPLILKKEIIDSKKKSIDVPKNTENIILQAEKYLKK